MYLLLLIAFTLGLVCEPLLARLFKWLQSTYRDYQFRRQMFKQDAFVKRLEANGWLLVPPDAQATIPYDRTKDFYVLDEKWSDAGKGTQ